MYNQAELTWKDLKVVAANGKAITNDIHGQIYSGELTVLLGPSGAGKTTVLRALAGRLPKSTVSYGSIWINSEARNPRTWPRITSFMEPVPAAYKWHTVYESLCFIAELRLSNTEFNSHKCVKNIVTELLEELNLKKVKNTRIENLSTGERVRFSICAELIKNPTVIFLDEPTTGLDSYSALKVVMLLNRLARDGRAVIASIHQPSSKMLKYFDKVILMAEGSVMYSGGLSGCIDLFSGLGICLEEEPNPFGSIFYLLSASSESQSGEKEFKNISNGDSSFLPRIEGRWKQIQGTVKPTIKHKIEFIPHTAIFQSIKSLTAREFRNVRNIHFRILQKLFICGQFIAFFSWMRFKEELSLCLTFLIFNGLYVPALHKFSKERAVIEGERRSGLYNGYLAYFINLGVETLISLIIEMPVFLVVYYFANMSLEYERLAKTFLAFVCFYGSSVSFALFLGVAAGSGTLASLVAVAANLFFACFSGIFASKENCPNYALILNRLSPAGYLTRAVLAAQLDGNSVLINKVSEEKIIETLKLDGISYRMCLLVMFLFSLAFSVAGSLLFVYKTKCVLKLRPNYKANMMKN
ncbi:hypothetical protein ENBRE01_0538 [Enteropsectra breve]|nr:hypothetical protein ENBRE01_0538 [Enteropsectra breve]